MDPLGSTQVVPYLEGLARTGIRFELITFEKRSQSSSEQRMALTSTRLKNAGIRWHPLRYHKAPRVPATLYDVGVGALLLRDLARTSRFDAFHCRGDITPMIVRLSRLEGPLLLDMRGFFSDERVDAGSWAANGMLDRVVRATEKGNLARARQIVVLTERGRDLLRTRGVTQPIEVIPTCVDCELFKPEASQREALFDLVYFGSLGGWYMTQQMLDFVVELRRSGQPLRVLFLTNNADAEAREKLAQAQITVQTCAPEDVPSWLAQCRATFFFIRATPSKIASCPTKLAEALAIGLPVLTGPGVGDVDKIVQEGRVGVVLPDFSTESYRNGWAAMTALLNDPMTPMRCRSVAESRLSLHLAIEAYRRAYDQLGETAL
ncbi:MAG: glycosyltransferase [Fimbriimonadaceae bacterium]|nr:glycosyltransferase [Fimbriimonadaceae bacterium]